VRRGPFHAHGPEISIRNEKPLVALVTLLVASQAAFQAYAWLVGALRCVVQPIP
jgi:hypothetical protein